MTRNILKSWEKEWQSGDTNIEVEWMNIKSSIVYATEKVLSEKEYKWRKEWFDEEGKDQINVKN